MDGAYYHDTRLPFVAVDQTQITLSTTDKALHTLGQAPALGANYFGFIGKKLHIHAFGKISTILTPGNGTWDIYYGTGADANGVIMTSSAALTLVASQTNISWQIDLDITCRTVGASGTLMCTGWGQFGTAVVAAGTFLIPASAAVASGAVDLTSSSLNVSLQFKRSGSTAEVMTIQEMNWWAMN